MKSEDNKLIFNKRDHNGERYISKTTFTLNFMEKDIKVVFSLNQKFFKAILFYIFADIYLVVYSLFL